MNHSEVYQFCLAWFKSWEICLFPFQRVSRDYREVVIFSKYETSAELKRQRRSMNKEHIKCHKITKRRQKNCPRFSFLLGWRLRTQDKSPPNQRGLVVPSLAVLVSWYSSLSFSRCEYQIESAQENVLVRLCVWSRKVFCRNHFIYTELDSFSFWTVCHKANSLAFHVLVFSLQVNQKKMATIAHPGHSFFSLFSIKAH